MSGRVFLYPIFRVLTLSLELLSFERRPNCCHPSHIGASDGDGVIHTV
jgi:hypothetical protein